LKKREKDVTLCVLNIQSTKRRIKYKMEQIGKTKNQQP